MAPSLPIVFQYLTEDSPHGLPPSLTGKMAVVHIDGNRFTKIREKALSQAGGQAEDKAKEFSDVVIRAGQIYWTVF